MTSVWEDLGADILASRIADDLRQMVTRYSDASARTMQSDLGPSDISTPCTKCLASRILGVYEDPPFSDKWRANVGTAVHSWLDEAAVADNVRNNVGRWFPELRVHPDPVLLPSGGRADLYDSDTKTVVDHKTKGGKAAITKIRTDGPPLGMRRQLHLYGLGYTNAGHDVHNVALAFWPRDGRLGDLWVHVEPYDELVALETLQRYDSLRDLCLAGGVSVLDSLPSDPTCWVCSRKAGA